MAYVAEKKIKVSVLFPDLDARAKKYDYYPDDDAVFSNVGKKGKWLSATRFNYQIAGKYITHKQMRDAYDNWNKSVGNNGSSKVQKKSNSPPFMLWTTSSDDQSRSGGLGGYYYPSGADPKIALLDFDWNDVSNFPKDQIFIQMIDGSKDGPKAVTAKKTVIQTFKATGGVVETIDWEFSW